MIKGTNTDCKITDISVVGSTATITCLFFATSKTEKTVGLKFYLLNKNEEEKYNIDNTTYWIDNINSYENNLLNKNVDGYLEVKLHVDITNNNTSAMQQSRWFRKCYLILANVEDTYCKPLWSSDLLDLVSTPIEIPEIKSLVVYNKSVYISSKNETENHLIINFKYSYKAEADFNYTNDNLKTYIISKSLTTGKIIEQIETQTKEKISVESSIGYTYNEPVLIEIYLTNLKDDILKTATYIYRPYIKRAWGYIKTANGVKMIKQIITKKDNLLSLNPNNLAVKINFNTPIYAHFDRAVDYEKATENAQYPDKVVRCYLHIDTFISQTIFKNVVFTASQNGNVFSQVADEQESVILLQETRYPYDPQTNTYSDEGYRIQTDNNVSINALYKNETLEKSIQIRPNKTVVCSQSVKLHKNLRPFNYNKIVNQEEEDNE